MPPPCPGSCTLSGVLSEGVQGGNLQGPPQSHCVPLQDKDKVFIMRNSAQQETKYHPTRAGADTGFRKVGVRVTVKFSLYEVWGSPKKGGGGPGDPPGSAPEGLQADDN